MRTLKFSIADPSSVRNHNQMILAVWYAAKIGGTESDSTVVSRALTRAELATDLLYKAVDALEMLRDLGLQHILSTGVDTHITALFEPISRTEFFLRVASWGTELAVCLDDDAEEEVDEVDEDNE